MEKEKTFYEHIIELRKNKKIPKQWRVRDIKPFLLAEFGVNTINVYPCNCSIGRDGKIKGDYVKKGQSPKFYRLGNGLFELIDEPSVSSHRQSIHYMDLIKAHKIFKEIESRWIFYDTYLKKRCKNIWMSSGDLPIEEGLFLFGFIQSWDPYFQGDLFKFIKTYKEIFPLIRKFERENIINITFDCEVKSTMQMLFDKIARSSRGGRFESTDTSKILHAILPEMFVMWDDKIRKGIFGEDKRDGKSYASEFLPKMQSAIKDVLDSYISEKGGTIEFACYQISRMLDGYTLAKLIDEYNYVRYTKRQKI